MVAKSSGHCSLSHCAMQIRVVVLEKADNVYYLEKGVEPTLRLHECFEQIPCLLNSLQELGSDATCMPTSVVTPHEDSTLEQKQQQCHKALTAKVDLLQS